MVVAWLECVFDLWFWCAELPTSHLKEVRSEGHWPWSIENESWTLSSAPCPLNEYVDKMQIGFSLNMELEERYETSSGIGFKRAQLLQKITHLIQYHGRIITDWFSWCFGVKYIYFCYQLSQVTFPNVQFKSDIW